MTVRPEVLLLILGAMAVTLPPRVLPLMFLDRIRLGPQTLAWLGYVVPAVITSLLVQESLSGDLGLLNPIPYTKIFATLIALITAFYTRSIILTVLLGIAAYALGNVASDLLF